MASGQGRATKSAAGRGPRRPATKGRTPGKPLQANTFDRAITIIQTLALVMGIGIAIYQSQKLRESIDTSTWASIAEQLTEIDKLFIDHPEFVPFFYDGVDIEPSNPNYLRAYSIAAMMIDFMDNASVLGDHIDPEIFEPDAWDRYYEYQFTNSPIICKIITEDQAIYGKRIVAIALTHCRKMSEISGKPTPRP